LVTREKIRAFVLAGREEAAPAIDGATSPPVEEAAPTTELAPGESESVLAAEQEPAESAIDGDVDGSKDGGAA
jgi:hypothetical protein